MAGRPAPPAVRDVIAVPEDPEVLTAFADRAAGNVSLVVGDGDVQAARRGLLDAVGLPLERAVFMEQVHGTRVAVVTADDAGRGALDHSDALAGVDAMVTTARGLGLVVMVADCVPVTLVAPGAAVGVAHAGRRGVEAGIVGSTVAALANVSGCSPTDQVALIGPAIGGCCYEVPLEMARSVTAAVPAARATTKHGSPGLDLPAAVLSQLQDAGVKRVEHHGGCTRCEPERWYSHRAAGQIGAAQGRQAAVACRAVVPPGNAPDRSLDLSP